VRLICVFAVLTVAGCLCAPPQSSCDYRPGAGLCTDLTTNPEGQAESTLMEFCTLGNGKYSTSLCDHSGSFGACVCDGCENGHSISWYFTDADAGIMGAADVMALCATEKHTYQAP
jgi:hypothetical protein